MSDYRLELDERRTVAAERQAKAMERIAAALELSSRSTGRRSTDDH